MLAFHSFQAITFDCYGTLIDWESGILRVLRPLLAEHGKPVDHEEILELYAELEPAIQAAKYQPYRLCSKKSCGDSASITAFPSPPMRPAVWRHR